MYIDPNIWHPTHTQAHTGTNAHTHTHTHVGVTLAVSTADLASITTPQVKGLIIRMIHTSTADIVTSAKLSNAIKLLSRFAFHFCVHLSA